MSYYFCLIRIKQMANKLVLTFGAVLVIICVVLAFHKYENHEHFGIPADKIALYQGTSVPLDPKSVSGGYKPGGGESKFVFAYNTCKPECCKSSPFSCNGSGCVCLEDKQVKYISSHGNNSHYKQGCNRKNPRASQRGIGFSAMTPANVSNSWSS